MTLTVAWVRQIKGSSELVVISDSRLRSRGAIDQAQKIFPLDRGDCALAFCGDTDVAYPLFVQVSSALNSYIRLRTRASDVTETARTIGRLLNNMIDSWDESLAVKRDVLKDTRILFAGWSWRKRRFITGFFKFADLKFHYFYNHAPLSRPWYERNKSLIVMGDYIDEYMRTLGQVLQRSNPVPNRWTRRAVNLEYEPLEALTALLERHSRTVGSSIGGAPQMIKVYPYNSVLPIVVRSNDRDHYLFGRKLAPWEKTEYPIAIVSPGATSFAYPMSHIPVPAEVSPTAEAPSWRAPFNHMIQLFTFRKMP